MEIIKIIKQAISRFRAETPKVFRKVLYMSGAITAAIIAINTEHVNYGFNLPQWWDVSMPYVIGFSAGLAALSLFTQRYGSDGKPIYKDEYYEERSN